MKTNFTVEDVKNLFEDIFNGNLEKHKISGGKIPYENENSEDIIFIDENTGLELKDDLAKYLNVKFYAWKERLVEKQNKLYEEDGELQTVDAWIESLNFSQNESYALVEIVDEDATVSQDIDNATILGRVSFIIQANKISNIDYYTTKIRNRYLGKTQEFQNSFGDILTCYLTIGRLVYEQEPIMTQLGEAIIVSFNFRLSYLNQAKTYTDTKIEFSLDGDDEYDESGNIVGETKYQTFPITKSTWQLIGTNTPLPTQNKPNITGVVGSALSMISTFSFFDYENKFLDHFRDLFWTSCAITKNSKEVSVQEVNIPIYVRVTDSGNVYVFKNIIDNIHKTITNGDFTILSMTLKGFGKIISL